MRGLLIVVYGAGNANDYTKTGRTAEGGCCEERLTREGSISDTKHSSELPSLETRGGEMERGRIKNKGERTITPESTLSRVLADLLTGEALKKREV